MAEDQDWRLRADLADPAGFHERLRGARHFEREMEPLVSHDVVLSYDDDTLFGYANAQQAVMAARTALGSIDGARGAAISGLGGSTTVTCGGGGGGRGGGEGAPQASKGATRRASGRRRTATR